MSCTADYESVVCAVTGGSAAFVEVPAVPGRMTLPLSASVSLPLSDSLTPLPLGLPVLGRVPDRICRFQARYQQSHSRDLSTVQWLVTLCFCAFSLTL